MRKWTILLAFIFIIIGPVGAQSTGSIEKTEIHPKSTTSVADPSRDLAFRLLQEAEADAGVVDASGRAGIQFLAGRTYTTIDKAKSRILLQSAYENALVAYEEKPTAIAFVLPDIAAATVMVSPDTVEQSLPADDASRDYVLRLLIKRYVGRKDLLHSIELLQMMRSDQAMTYGAIELLMAIPASRQDDRDRVFASVLRSYRGSKHYQVGTGAPEDLGTLVVRFHRSVSGALVREAIDELLAQAKGIPVNVRMSTLDRTDTFTAYQFRLFQLLPALREIDPTKAEMLLKEDSSTAVLLKPYPEGQRSVDPWLRETPMTKDETKRTAYTMIDNDSRVLQVTGPLRIRSVEPTWKPGDNPDDAIAKAAQMTDSAARARLLLDIADGCKKSNPNSARSALRMLRSKPPEDPNQFMLVVEGAKIAQKLGDKDLANSLVEVGLKEAHALYEFESDKDDPNTALKLNWVSTRAYREFLSIQIKLDPDAAMQVLKELPDTELRGLENVAVAAALLNVPLPSTSPYGKAPKAN